MTFVNLTQHELNILDDSGDAVFDVKPSGNVARVSTNYTPVDRGVDGVPTNVASTGDVTGLPAPQPGVVYLVSGQVRAAVDRTDVASPGPLVRDDNGRPVGARGLTFAA